MAPTPKFRSSEFKDALASLKEIFDAHSLSVVLVGGLERRATEQVYKKFARGQMGRRIQNIKKTELVGQLVAGFFSTDEVAFQIMREMDRACDKERHIVASIPEAHASERIGSYRAIALKRQRSKFVWALGREDRPVVRDLANRVIKEFFEEAADIEVSKAAVEGTADPRDVQGVDMARRLTDQAERLDEATEKLTNLESQVSHQEAERARLIAQIGSKQRALKEETQARGDLEAQITDLRTALGNLESDQDALVVARQNEDRAKARAEELAQKVRRLSKLAAVSDRVSELQAELEAAKRVSEERQRSLSRAEAGATEAQAEFAAERDKLQAHVQELREDLKRARKQITELEKRPEAARGSVADGVMVLLDQANLAASAHAVFNRKVNFAALLERLAAGRKVRRAVAFVVDNGGTQFEAFCDTLRRAGWELRVKKTKHFRNGRTKADWDMGLAVDAIEHHDKAETLVLVSGDGDFAPLVRLLKRRGLQVEVAAFSEALATELAEAADAVTRLDTGTLE